MCLSEMKRNGNDQRKDVLGMSAALCDFVSPRGGIACQVRGAHDVHRAWNAAGIPTLKMHCNGTVTPIAFG